MRRLVPEPGGEIDPYEAYGDVPGTWLRVHMVASVDGSVTDEEGWSTGLGGEADFRVFRVMRALADGILVGAATIRTGRMGPAKLTSSLRARRGRGPAPIVVVTRSAALDWGSPLFTEAETPTIVVTTKEAAGSVPDAVRVVAAGAQDVDLGEAIRQLRSDYGLGSLLCEGGPSLATSLLREGLVDELCLNVAPTLIGAEHHTAILGEGLGGRVDLRLSAAYLDEGVLFLRYVRT